MSRPGNPGRMDPGRTLDAALVEHSLEATRDVKRWENALLQEQLTELEACGVHKWLETTKRGLGLFLCLDSGGKLVVSGVEAPSSATSSQKRLRLLSLAGSLTVPEGLMESPYGRWRRGSVRVLSHAVAERLCQSIVTRRGGKSL